MIQVVFSFGTLGVFNFTKNLSKISSVFSATFLKETNEHNSMLFYLPYRFKANSVNNLLFNI